MSLADRWCRRRWSYRLGLTALFGLIAFYFGPTVIIFHRFSWLTPADFVPDVHDRCEPVVRAMKAYKLAHGRWPKDNDEIGFAHNVGYTRNGEYEFWGRWNHRITYDFTAGREGWYVSGAFTHGRIPLPPVPTPATEP